MLTTRALICECLCPQRPWKCNSRPAPRISSCRPLRESGPNRILGWKVRLRRSCLNRYLFLHTTDVLGARYAADVCMPGMRSVSYCVWIKCISSELRPAFSLSRALSARSRQQDLSYNQRPSAHSSIPSAQRSLDIDSVYNRQS